MSTRKATLVLKHSDIVNRTLPTSLLLGEGIVNTADGILLFSGSSTSSNNWTPAGTGTTATFFEVGSNLYDLAIRNKITKYQNQTNLTGKFLSGTSAGFVLADISSIIAVDNYVTGFTYNAASNTFTIKQNNGIADLTAVISAVSGLTVNGNLNVTGTITGPTSLTVGTISATTYQNLPTDVFVTGGTYANGAATFRNNTGGTFSVTGFFSGATDVFVTGGTYANNGTLTFRNNTGGTFTVAGITGTTGGTYNATTGQITFTRNDGTTFTVGTWTYYTSAVSSGNNFILTKNDTTTTTFTPNAVTGGTYSNGVITLAGSGTLSNITGLLSADTFVTGGTYSNGIITFRNNTGGTFNVSGLISADTFTTGATYNASTGTFTFNRTDNVTYTAGTLLYVTATTQSGNLLTLTRNNNTTTTYTPNAVTGGTYANGVITLAGTGTLSNITGLLSADTFVTGGTYAGGTITFVNNTGGTFSVTGISGTDTFTTAFTYNNNVLTIRRNQGQPDLSVVINTVTGLTVNGTLTSNIVSATTVTAGTLNLTGSLASYNGTSNVAGKFLSGTTNGFVLADISTTIGVDTYVTGFTYNAASNAFTIKQNNGVADLTTNFTTVSGLTVSNLTADRVVYTTTGGLLTTGNAIFDGTNMTLPTTGSLTVGTGGLVVGSGGSIGAPGTGNVVIHGSLTVFGDAISAVTTQLYVEDPNIIINYNPTGSTTSTSVGAGFTVQDGAGTTNNNVSFEIRALNSMTGTSLTCVPDTSEYTSSTGYANRGWVTQLNDIVIRSNNLTQPGGVRLIAECDIIDGGTY